MRQLRGPSCIWTFSRLNRASSPFRLRRGWRGDESRRVVGRVGGHVVGCDLVVFEARLRRGAMCVAQGALVLCHLEIVALPLSGLGGVAVSLGGREKETVLLEVAGDALE